METIGYIFSLSVCLVIAYLWVSFSFSNTNRQNIEKYHPQVFPRTNPLAVFSESIALWGMALLFTAWVTVLSENPLIFIPVVLAMTILVIYLSLRKKLFVYFLEDKLVLWKPALFRSEFAEIKTSDVEALIFKTRDEISDKLSQYNVPAGCSINIKAGDQKKSFDLDPGQYDLKRLLDYFNQLGKPVYTKVYYEKTARRIN